MTAPGYARLRDELMARRGELAAQLVELEAELQAPMAADFAEQASESEESQTLEGLEAARRQEITEIDATLARIGNGHYGVCTECGAPIAPARLAALPTAVRCIACAS